MISVILPVRDEPGINDFLDQVYKALSPYQVDQCEVIVVMGDKEKLHTPIFGRPNLKVVTSYADSLERSILMGLSFARGQKIVVLDADGSHLPEQIPEFIHALDTYDLVVGSRYVQGSSFSYSFTRRFVSWCFKTFMKIIGTRLTDPMSGYFGLRKEILKNIKFKPYTWKTGLEIERKSPNILTTDIPIKFSQRDVGESKASARVGVKIIRDMLVEVIYN